jgi:two-component system alkaline phosphatase synthesis response regulator PhoP
MKQILVVDDEARIAEICRDYLERAGFKVLIAANGADALTLARTKQPDLVVLDLGLPKMDGLDVTRALRQRSNVPIIMLTARVEESDKLVGLELGADDYVTKPFSPRELATRVRTVLRRATATDARTEVIEMGALTLDAGTREVHRDGDLLELTAKEFDLLWFLASNPNRVFSRDQLMDRVWGYTSAFDSGTVTVHVRRLREKIELDPSDPVVLETVWGVGYRLRA